jgi:hypothetical protein
MGEKEEVKLFEFTDWGYKIINPVDKKQVGAGVGLHPTQFHPDAEYSFDCPDCGVPFKSTVPKSELENALCLKCLKKKLEREAKEKAEKEKEEKAKKKKKKEEKEKK